MTDTVNKPTSDRGRVLHRERKPNANFDLIEPLEPVETIYTDGIGQAMIAPAMSKLSLYLVETAEVDAEKNILVESRVVNMKLVMPTRALIEFCLHTLKNLKTSQPVFEAYSAQTVELVKTAVQSVK